MAVFAPLGLGLAAAAIGSFGLPDTAPATGAASPGAASHLQLSVSSHRVRLC